MAIQNISDVEEIKEIEIIDDANILAINDILDFLIKNTMNKKFNWKIIKPKNNAVLVKDYDDYTFYTYIEYKGMYFRTFEISKNDCSHIKIRNMIYSYTDSDLISKTEKLYNIINDMIYNQIYGLATDELQKLSHITRGASICDNIKSNI